VGFAATPSWGIQKAWPLFRIPNSEFRIKKTPEGALPGLDAGLKMKAELHFHNFCGLRPFGAFDDFEFHLLPFR
jgi:hypothetical protein